MSSNVFNLCVGFVICVMLILVFHFGYGWSSCDETPLTRVQKYFSPNIPKVIYMCYNDKNDIPQFVIDKWVELNPDYELKLFGDPECYQSILENYGTMHADFFQSIPDGPIRSDFWRACILHKYGGVYVDADIEPVKPLNTYLQSKPSFLTCKSGRKREFNPHLIAVTPKHYIIKECIGYILSQRDDKPYYYWKFSIVTAINRIIPRYFTRFNFNKDMVYFDLYGNRMVLLQENLNMGNNGRDTCTFRNEVVLYNRYTTYNKHSFQK